MKHSHHAQFDKAWYLQPTCPPTAKLLYDLGLEADDDSHISVGTTDSAKVKHIRVLPAPWPPLPPHKFSELQWYVPPLLCIMPLPLREIELPRPIAAAAARVQLEFMFPSSLTTNTTLGLLSLGMDSTIHYFLHLHILFVHTIYQTVDCGGGDIG